MQQSFSRDNREPHNHNTDAGNSAADTSDMHTETEPYLESLMSYHERVGAIRKQLITLIKAAKESNSMPASFETCTFGKITLSENRGCIAISGERLKNLTTGGFLIINNGPETDTSLLENALRARFSGRELSARDTALLDSFQQAERDLTLTERIGGELLFSEQLNNIQ
jgi:hypothetical protein